MTYNGVNGVVKLLFPELKASDVFIGMVKTKAERYTKYGKLAADCGRPFLLLYGSYKMEKILEFLGKKKFPLITKWSESNTAWVYSTPVKLQVMIFAKADDFQSMAQPLEDIARRFKSKLMFIYIDITNENLAMPFLTLFGIEDANKTVVRCSAKEKCKIDLCVVRITGSSNMFEGINLSRCSELMKEEGESADADIASCYYHWLLRGIHVVTTTHDRSELSPDFKLFKSVA
ncbi:hypothetical protein YC2023_010555 [Brassica napus]